MEVYMKRFILALFLVVLSVSISGACYVDTTKTCDDCTECSTLFTWTTDGLPNPGQLNILLHQLLPVFEDIDCVTIQNASGECEVLDDPMDFIHFNYREFASSVCENTTLKFFDCDGGTNTVPIPGAFILLFSGLVGLGIIKRGAKDE